MPLTVQSNYSGEALEELLVRATTGNEIVERGLIRVVPDIKDKYHLPRLKVGKMLQKHKEQPDSSNSKGDIKVDERTLEPREVMAYTEFNPRAFEYIWRKFQPKGDLLFAELNDTVKNQLLSEVAKVVDFELADHIINGEYADGSDDTKLFDGILTRIEASNEVVKIATPVALTEANILDRIKAVYSKIPKQLRTNKNLRFAMSITDFDKYDDALSALPNKGTAYTDTNAKRFKGITIEPIAAWPENVIVATVISNSTDSNFWMGVSAMADTTTVTVDKVTNAGERYFIKMLMKIDTNIAFPGDIVLYDGRSAS